MSNIEWVIVLVYGTIGLVCLIKGLWPVYKRWILK